MPIISGSSGGLAGAGKLLVYNQITANANITDTSEATATALITSSAFTFDGTAVWAEFYTDELLAPTSGFVVATLFEGATQITRLATLNGIASAQSGASVLARYKFTPSAGSHTYKVCAFAASTTGTPRITAGAGGTATDPPAYLAFYKA